MNLCYKEILVGKIEDLVDYGHIQLGTIVSNDEFYKYREDIESNDEKVSVCVDSQMYEIIVEGMDEDEISFVWKSQSPFSLEAKEYFENRYYNENIDFSRSEELIQFELHNNLKEFYKKTDLRKLRGVFHSYQIKATEKWGQWFLGDVDVELFGVDNKDNFEEFIEAKLEDWTGGNDFGSRIWIGELEDSRGQMLILFNNDTGKVEWLDTEYGCFGNLEEDPNGVLADSIDELIEILAKNKEESLKPLSPDNTNFYEIKKLFGIDKFHRCGCSPYDIENIKDEFENIPKVLVDYYLELGGNEKLNLTQDKLISPDELYICDNGYLVFYEENQRACVWGIKYENLTIDNPPVYMAYDEDKEWVKESETLTEFFIAMAYMQGSLGLPYTSEEMYEIEEDGADKIRNNFKNKHISMNTWMSVEFYGNNETDIIALIKNDGFYNVACGSLFEKNFHEIEEFINRL